MNTKIVAFAGQMGSGKSSCSNFVVGTVLWGLRIVRESYRVTDSGKLWVSDLYGDSNAQGIFDMRRERDLTELDSLRILYEDIYPNIKQYAFADKLKQLCVDVLGLNKDHVYGSQEDKLKPSHLRWENMPGVYVNKEMYNLAVEANPQLEDVITYHKDGIMSVREVLQFVGTEIFRHMHENAWVDATLKQIERDDPLFATIDDLRLKNEAQALKEAGATIIKLTRNENKDAKHKSENDLLDYDGFDYVIDNANLSIQQQNEQIKNIMQEIGILPA